MKCQRKTSSKCPSWDCKETKKETNKCPLYKPIIKGKIKKHELKCWPEYFEDIVSGKKTFEIRKNDSGFKVGDILVLIEFKACDYCYGSGRAWDNGDMTECGCSEPHGKYTGEKLEVEITYILNGGQFGIEEGYVVMGIKKDK